MARQNVNNLPFHNVDVLIVGKFGEPFNGQTNYGVCFTLINDEDVYSMINGQVISVVNNDYNLGNYLIIKENNTGYGFLYGNMDTITVIQNSFVSNGTQVGTQSWRDVFYLQMQDLHNRSWVTGNINYYMNPATWIGYTETLLDNLYYTYPPPTPPTPTPTGATFPKEKFPWVLYSRKLRK